jgi:hypothetical protein
MKKYDTSANTAEDEFLPNTQFEAVAAQEYSVADPSDYTFAPSPIYDKYLATGEKALKQASLIKQLHGADAAAPYYDSARQNFIGAIYYQPVGTNNDKFIMGITDPKLQVNYAITLDELVESGHVPDYEGIDGPIHKDAKYKDRTIEWKRIAGETLVRALETMALSPMSATKEEVELAILAEQRLAEHSPRLALSKLAEVRQNMVSHNSDPNLVATLDEFTTMERDLQPHRAQTAFQHLLDRSNLVSLEQR